MSSVQETYTEVSLKSQVPGTRLEGGREYTEQDNVQYVLPKDVQELDRLHKQHLMLKIAFQGNFEAPLVGDLKKGITVLDSGCGPGSWVLEMAEAFPNSTFHGMDMAPVFPEQNKPQNCEFRLGNLNEKLPYPDNYFDYIHQRLLVIGLTAKGWENALAEFYRVLKPGGWIELKEVQMTFIKLGPIGKSLMNTWTRAFTAKGFLPDVASDLGVLLEKKGFEGINVTKLSIPINHGGILGALNWADGREILIALRPLLAMQDLETYGDDNFDNAVEAAGAEFAEYGSASNWFCFYGQKPLA